MIEKIVWKSDDKKYMVVWEHFKDRVSLKAYRYGEFWQDLIGDNMILSMLFCIDDLRKEIEELKAENAELKARLEKAVELPCKVGEKVVAIFEFEEEPILEFGKVDSISVDESGIWINCFYESGLRYYHKRKDEEEIGLIFFGENAKAEAEKALKEKGE